MPARCLVVALVLALLPRAPLRGEEAHSGRPPRFASQVEVVSLNVTVTDGGRNHIAGLQSADFQLFEDGVPQELTLFLHDAVPLSVVVMIDCSASMYEALPAVKAAAQRLLDALRPRDRARIVGFSDRDVILQDFTSDRDALRQAVARAHAIGPTALYKSLYVALKDLTREKRGTELRRLAVVLLSDGKDTASRVSDEQILELARRTEIGIYPIALGLGSSSQGQVFNEAAYFLTRLAQDTGGEVHFPRALRDLDGVYDRIADELRMQYTLGYVSANSRRDGRWRRIQVRARARRDLSLRHRLGYYAPAR